MPYKFAVTSVASLIMNYTKYNMSDLTSEEIPILKAKLGLSSDEILMGEDVYSIIDNRYVKTKEIPLIETVYAIYDIIEAREITSNMENNKVKNYLAEKELSDCIEYIFEDLNEYFNGVSFSTVEDILHNYKRDSLKSASVVSAKINS